MTDEKAVKARLTTKELLDEFILSGDRLYQIGYSAGKAEGMALLDKAWAEINALYNDNFTSSDIWRGKIDARNIIEKLGGMNPAKRSE